MSVKKVNFTSSILSDMTAKAATFQVNKQPEQQAPVENNQQSAVAQTPVPETITKPENKTKRNTIIGLSAAALLISLGVAGRKGKLGPKLQKFLGGTERVVERNADSVSEIGTNAVEHSRPTEIKPSVEHPSHNIEETITPSRTSELKSMEESIHTKEKPEVKPLEEPVHTNDIQKTNPVEQLTKPLEENVSEGIREVNTMQIEPANTDATIAKLNWLQRRKIAKINSIIDREIPVIDESLKTLKIPTKEEAMEIVKKEIDLKAIDISKGTKQSDGTLRCIETRGDYEYTIDFNPDKTVQYFRKENKIKNDLELSIVLEENEVREYDDFLQHIIISKSKDGWGFASKTLLGKYTMWYNFDGTIKSCSTDVLRSNGGITTYKGHVVSSSRIEYVDGKINHIKYYSPKTGELLKTEFLDDTGKIIKEKYEIGKKGITVLA